MNTLASDDPLIEARDAELRFRLLVPALLIATVTFWAAWLTWTAWRGSGTNRDITQGLVSLCAVATLCGVIWLLTLRTSRTEARRFGSTARAMRAEARALEETVARLVATMEDSRTTIAEQANHLGRIGDEATARLAAIESGLSDEIGRADAGTRLLTNASDEARHALEALTSGLPATHQRVEAITGGLERIASVTEDRMTAMEARLHSLAEQGRALENSAGSAGEALSQSVLRLEQASDTAFTRLSTVSEATTVEVDRLLERLSAAIDEARRGVTAQGDSLLAMVGANQAALDIGARESTEALAERIEVIEIVIDRVARRLETQRIAGDGMVASLESGIDRIEGRFDGLETDGTEKLRSLGASITGLEHGVAEMNASLAEGESNATRAIGAMETLLIALDSAAREIDETLPQALGRLDGHLSRSREAIAAVRPDILALVSASQSTHDAVNGVGRLLADQRITAEGVALDLAATLETSEKRVAGISETLRDATDRSAELSAEAAPRLIEALTRVRATADAAAEHARKSLGTVIPEATRALESAMAVALRHAANAGIDEQIAALGKLSETAVTAATLAAKRLEGELARISEVTEAVDHRINAADGAREASDRESFSRRASLLIEALNSASIDLGQSLSGEVSDTAWAAYLKGDRGVFTRRAVRLLDGAQQRDIAQLYETDAGVREQINRYIHDFEALLRIVLAQREGSALGVTLLSSDVGKLYVALAQGIDRLR